MENGFNGNGKKRGRKEIEESLVNEDELKKSGFGDILSSILSLDEEAKQEQNHWVTDTEQDRAFFGSNYKQKVEEMNDYFDQLQNQNHCSEMEELDSSRNKRARRSSVPVVSAAATVSAGSDNVGPSQSGSGTGHQRRLWVKDRSKDWWDKCSHPDFPDEEFKRAFRMSKATFNMICEELEPAVMKKTRCFVTRSRFANAWRFAFGGWPRVSRLGWCRNGSA